MLAERHRTGRRRLLHSGPTKQRCMAASASAAPPDRLRARVAIKSGAEAELASAPLSLDPVSAQGRSCAVRPDDAGCDGGGEVRVDDAGGGDAVGRGSAVEPVDPDDPPFRGAD